MQSWNVVAWVLVAACGEGRGSSPDAPADTGKPIDAAIDTPVDTPVDMGNVGANILTNADFEALDGSGWLTSWTRHEGDPNGQLVVVTQPVHGGTHALQWQMSAASGYEYFVIQDPVATSKLVPGTMYEVDGWAFIDVSPSTVRIGLNYIVRGEPGGEPDLETVSQAPMFPTVANTWERFHFRFTVPAGAMPQRYRVYLHAMKSGTGPTVPVKLTVDDVSIHPLL